MIPRLLLCVDGTFLGCPRGGRYAPPWLRAAFGAAPRKFVFWAFLVDFAIFSGLLKIIMVLGIRVLVSTEYLKTLYILYSEW
jgi:hypothetical protein